MEGFAEVGWVGVAAGIARLALQSAGEDLLLEAVHAVRDGLQIVVVAEARCDGGLGGESAFLGGEDGLGCGCPGFRGYRCWGLGAIGWLVG